MTPIMRRRIKSLSAPAKTGGESGAGAAGEQKRKSADGGSPKIATSAMQSIETKRTTATEVRANWHLAAVRRMRQTLTKKRTEQPRVRMQPTIRRGAYSVCEYRSAGEPAVLGESSKLAWPIAGNVLLNYSMDKTIYFPTLQQYKYNPSIVISAAEGTGVACAADGIVESVYEDAQTGQTVVMRLGGGMATYGQRRK